METRPIDALRPHPRNAQIYGDSADADFIASIGEHGVQEPILITVDGTIISGHRRYEAARQVGLEQVPVIIHPATNEWEVLIALLECNRQRQKTVEQKLREVSARKEALEHLPRPQGGRPSTNAGVKPPPNSGEVSPPGTRHARESLEIAAKEQGVGRTYAADGLRVLDVIDRLEAQGQQEEAQAVRRTLNEKSVHRAQMDLRAGIIAPHAPDILTPGQHSTQDGSKLQQNGQRQARRQERFDRLVAPDFNTITGPFPVIYADPPWQYDANTADPSRVIENHYPTMPLEEICALDVPRVCAQHAILFLWSPMPKLAEALRVMKEWGFEYRTGFVWVKGHAGMGHWVRMRHELLLLGRRGDMPTPLEANRQDSVIEAARGVHSAKPEQAYHLIEQMYPDVPRLELFARGTGRAGWTAWGNEVAPAGGDRVG